MNTVLDCVDWAFANAHKAFAIGAIVTFGLYLKGMYPSIRKRRCR